MKATVIRAEALIVAFLTAISKGDYREVQEADQPWCLYPELQRQTRQFPPYDRRGASRPQGLLLCQLLIGAGAAVNGTNVFGGNPSLNAAWAGTPAL